VLSAADAGVPALGYVVEYAELVASLRKPLAELLTTEELPARCVVHAEGMSPDAEVKRYAQDGLVALVEMSPPQRAVAFERFTREGRSPCCRSPGVRTGLEPAAGESAGARRGAASRVPAGAECRRRHAAWTRVGVEARAVQPLSLRVRDARIGERSAYIGNAAQTLHPVAGQGLNLGLRDAWELAQIMRTHRIRRRRDACALRARRRLDAGATIRATDLLAGIFLGVNPLAAAARGARLTALDIFPAPRRFFARRHDLRPSALP
jgi:2-octaprenyl-6-methoxyphenol hydroxylase